MQKRREDSNRGALLATLLSLQMARKRLLLPMFAVAALGVGAVLWLQSRPDAAPAGRHEAEPATKSAETGDDGAGQKPLPEDQFVLIGGEVTATDRVLEVGQPLALQVEWTAGERTCFDKGKNRLCVDPPTVFKLENAGLVRLTKGLAHLSVVSPQASVAVDEATASCQDCEFEVKIEGEAEGRLVTIRAIRGTLAVVQPDGTSRTMEKATEIELGPGAPQK
jgi:hypothetical protein